jgi:putative transposase
MFLFLWLKILGAIHELPLHASKVMHMKSEKPNRSSIRLPFYDYNQTGAYFITVCVANRECLLGDIVDEKMYLSEIGRIAQNGWDKIKERFPQIELDTLVIMPNHIHGIIVIKNVGAIHESPLRGQSRRILRRRMLLSKAIGYFKMNSAKGANLLRNTSTLPFWQRNYYEHVIRNDTDLEEIREYIQNNPLKWLDDENHPANMNK